MSVTPPPMTPKTARHRSRRHGKVRFIVLHDTVGRFPGDLDYLAGPNDRSVSADFYIRRNGDIYQLNPDLVTMKTHHAGKSAYQGFTNLNECSLGIEMEHYGDRDDWPPPQVSAAARLCAWLVEHFRLDLGERPITSHQRVALPPGRKSDPRGFPWEAFGQETRRLLGETSDPVRLVFEGKALPVHVKIVDGACFAPVKELTEATRLRPLLSPDEDGSIGVRPFFEACGYRAEWDAASRTVTLIPVIGGR